MKKFGFLSLGLIGGSIAKAIKIAHPDASIIAYARRQETLDEALKDKTIDYGTTTIDESFYDCDLIFLCAPVSINNVFIDQLKNVISPDTILTDVGSVKGTIHKKIESVGLTAQFIGGHPMAGSEKTGFEHSNASILENAYYILTPTEDVPSQKVDAYYKLVEDMHAVPLVLSYQQHDYVTAGVSHVPHLVAAALANLVHDHDSDDGIMKTIAAGGFKDITRIASSSPDMWEAICMANSQNIADLLDDYIASLQRISKAVRKEQKGFTFDLFTASKDYRDSFTNASPGPIKKVYGCYAYIPDETGSLSNVVMILAKENISIKNIGIVHNREFEEGVLGIEFYDEKSLQSAKDVLRKLNYQVYDRR